MSAVVTQADREAAADYGRDAGSWPTIVRLHTREGKCDDLPLVQAFARHRFEAVEELVAALKEARGQVVGFMLECGHSPEAAVANVARLDATLSKHRAPIAQGGS